MKKIFTIFLLLILTYLTKAQNLRLVKDIDPGFSLASSTLLYSFDNKVLLKFTKGVTSVLYVSDGTEANTKAIVNSPTELSNYGLTSFTNALDGNLYFYQNHYGDNKTYLYKLDKNNFDLEKIITINGVNEINDILFYNSALYYLQDDDLRKYTGNGNSELVKNFGNFGSSTLTAYKGKMFVIASAPTSPLNHALYESDGSTQGTKLIKILFQPYFSVSPAKSYIFNDILYMATEEHQLFRTDGTTEGTYKLLDINEGTKSRLQMLELNGNIFFTACTDPDQQYLSKLYKTDGSLSGTTEISFLSPHNNISSIAKLGDSLYLKTDEGLYLWNGVSESTVHVHNSYNMLGVYSDSLICINSSRYVFMFKDGFFNEKKVNGNSFEYVNFMTAGDKLFFVGEEENGSIGEELYVLDGFETNTRININPLLSNVYPNPSSGIINFQSELYGGQLKIYDMTGKRVGNSMVLNRNIDISNLNNGVYFLSISKNSINYYGKIILNK